MCLGGAVAEWGNRRVRLNYLDLAGHRLFLVPELNSPSVLLRLKLLGLKQAPMSPIAPRRCTRSASSLPPKFSAR